MRKVLWCVLPLWVAMSSPAALAAVPDEWKRTAYAYEADQAQLSTVLTDFANSFNVKLELDDKVTGVVNGHMRADNPKAFLDRLALESHFQWFVYNNTLYVSPMSEQTSTRIEVSPDGVEDLQKALTDVGLLDPRFGWGILPDDGVVLVRGPKRYVDFIREYSAKVDTPEDKQDIIVLPLRYANAADRTITYRDQQLTVTGVASILQSLLENGSRGQSINGVKGSATTGAAGTTGSASMRNALTGIMGGDGDGMIPPPDFTQLTSSSSGRGHSGSSAKATKIRVEADVRNNSVLIYDLPKRRAMYQKLVAQLDVPRNLVEIDAIILDIDRKDLAELSSSWAGRPGKYGVAGGLMSAGQTATLSITDYKKFTADLHALESNGSASIIGNPSVLTLENQPAVIDFSRTEYLTATGERVATIAPITAGTSLQVIPRSLNQSGKQQIQMVVDIEDGQIETSQINDEQPSVRRGNVSTQAVVAEQGSLVIGGFHSTEDRSTVSKVPLLGDIPVIGKLLFRSTDRTINKRERLFILTPRIIGDQVDPARYVENGDPHAIDDAVNRIKNRREGPEKPTRGDVQRAMIALASGQVPEGFDQGTALPFVANTLCDTSPLGVVLEDKRSQWFNRDAWGVAVVVARNTSPVRVRLDESLCGGRWVLGVGAYPHAWLEPGEETEVFVAMRQPSVVINSSEQPRASLLQPAGVQP